MDAKYSKRRYVFISKKSMKKGKKRKEGEEG
jgi:hypothetical protein